MRRYIVVLVALGLLLLLAPTAGATTTAVKYVTQPNGSQVLVELDYHHYDSTHWEVEEYRIRKIGSGHINTFDLIRNDYGHIPTWKSICSDCYVSSSWHRHIGHAEFTKYDNSHTAYWGDWDPMVFWNDL